MKHDLVIVGGGIVGAAAALAATDAGASVVLYDRIDDGRATDAGAGIVGPALNKRDDGPLLDLQYAAAAYYPRLIERIERAERPGTARPGTAQADAARPDTAQADAARSTGYRQSGLLAVALDDTEADQFDRLVARAESRISRLGHPTNHQLQVLDADEALATYPLLTPPTGAILDPGAARVDGAQLTQTMLAVAAEGGAEIRQQSVESLSELAGVAPVVLIAGGAWTGAFSAELGAAVPVVPQRGQIAHLQLGGDDPHRAATDRWPMLSLFSDQYQVWWPEGRVAVGATREHRSGFDRRVTAGAVLQVLVEATRAAPGLAQAELLEVKVGLRPLTPDLAPIIDRIPPAGPGGRSPGHGFDVVVATGHGPNGLLLGPYTAKLAVDLALDQSADLVRRLAPFGLGRFA